MPLQTDLSIARRLCGKAIAQGYSVSVYDGEVWVVHCSKDIEQIMPALASTDCDTLAVVDANGIRIGSILMVWGNGEDVISDWSWPKDKPENEAILEQLCGE